MTSWDFVTNLTFFLCLLADCNNYDFWFGSFKSMTGCDGEKSVLATEILPLQLLDYCVRKN